MPDWPLTDFGHSYVWRTGDVPIPADEGGQDEGRIVIRLDVDGQYDIVCAELGQTGQIVGLDRAIEALQHLRDALSTCYGANARPGRCMASGDWGRCLTERGHASEHRFPTQVEWELQRGGRTAVAS